MAVLINDRELMEALLRGEKLEKVRHAGFGEYIYLQENMLVDKHGKPANIYRLSPSDLFQTIENKDD
ncbi:hypothetical protein N9948_01510 [bacterium]|nr:hypothetical protein [bacterium]